MAAAVSDAIGAPSDTDLRCGANSWPAWRAAELTLLTVLAVAGYTVALGSPAQAAGGGTTWQPDAAGRYLDERAKVWFASAKCVSCHTGLPYALARPALHQLRGIKTPAEEESKLLAQVRRRVANWDKLDTQAFGLYYDANDVLKKQSWGTEAVFNAAILAFDDRYHGRSSPSAATRLAFEHLWQTQIQTGTDKGSWEWLDFGEAPWGNAEARYFGAALAAVAVATGPGYYKHGPDVATDAGVNLLRGYLKRQFPKENLHNRVWSLWAAAKLDGVLTKADRQRLIRRLLDGQRADGGWSLPSLGTWVRNDHTAQETASDGYATALVLHVLQTAGVPKDNVQVARGLDWLRRSQTTTGAWRSVSLVKKRDPATHTGKFMSDAATAFAVLALSH
jgi:squalene-hopene/tetraprenyl-beta-curcumene cyclase